MNTTANTDQKLADRKTINAKLLRLTTVRNSKLKAAIRTQVTILEDAFYDNYGSGIKSYNWETKKRF